MPYGLLCADIAHQIQLVHRLGEHWESVLPGRALHVRYEDLVRDQVRFGFLFLGIVGAELHSGWGVHSKSSRACPNIVGLCGTRTWCGTR